MKSLIIQARDYTVKKIGTILGKQVDGFVGSLMSSETDSMLLTLRRLLADGVLLRKIIQVLKITDPKVCTKFEGYYIAFRLIDACILDGIHFHVSAHSFDRFINNPYKNLHTYKAEHFNTPIPNDLISFTFEGEDTLYILSKESSNTYSHTCFKYSQKEGIYTTSCATLFLDKLPRIFMECRGRTQCDKSIKITMPVSVKRSTKLDETGYKEYIKTYCMKTPRTCHICDLIEEHKNKGLKELLFAERCVYSVIICFEILKYFNEDPQTLYREYRGNTNKSKTEKSKKYEDIDIILVNKRKYVYTNYVNSEEGVSKEDKAPRQSPCEHSRIGHYRHYKNGKKTWIPANPSINKGKGRKIYKV